MIFATLVLLFVAAAVNSQVVNPVRDYRVNPYYDESPKPYAFNYNALLDDGVGSSSRSETADGSGRVQGSYTLTNDEGHSRVVEYIADQDGFRATVRTNEPGTDNQNPADVIIESSAPSAYTPYNYNPTGRRPVLNAAVEPLAPVAPVEPADIAPENVIPARRQPVYRRPPVYNPGPRPNVYRQPVRNPYIRN